MQAEVLKSARLSAGLTQAQAAERLGVTQALLSMLESGRRAVSPKLASEAVKVFGLRMSAMLLPHEELAEHSRDWFFDMLGTLGYPGFSHYSAESEMNPADFLLAALSTEDLPARVTEALPWLLLAYPAMDWDWLVTQVKIRDVQNRLGFLLEMALYVAKARDDRELTLLLGERRSVLERSRLAREDTLCQSSMLQSERRWLRENGRDAARQWNLLSNLKPEYLPYVEE